MSAATPLPFQQPEAPEDQARAGYYALLARLFYASPDAALLESMARADEIVASDGESALATAWNALAAAARAMDAEAARVEYDELFVGTGKSEVTLYTSFYLVEAGREKILARLRAELAGMGLERTERALEPEDHVAGLFDAMRYLISLGSNDAALRKQQEFFDCYIARSHERLCAAISASQKSNFYKPVARFAEAFLAVESEAMKVF